MKKIILNLFLLTSLLISAKGQTGSPNWKYLRTTNTGIGGDYSFVTEADRCGNIWTGGYLPFHAQGSLVRFNDTTWTSWSNFEGYIPGSIVTAIAFDNNDGVWVGCDENQNFGLHGGVAHYDGSTWTMWNSTNSPLSIDYVKGIVVDHNNIVWITFYDVQTGSGGVAKFDGTTWTIYTPSNSNLPADEVKDIDVDAQNNIWIGCNLGLIKFDGLNWTLFTSANSGLSINNGVKDVEVDEVTNKVYAVTVFSVDIYDNGVWSHINSTNSPVGNANLAEVDAHGDTVIIGSLNTTSGVFIFDGTSWTTHVAPGFVYDVRIDYEGKYWACGIGFVEKFDGLNWKTYDKMNTGLPAMQNNDVFIDTKNRAWFASNLNGGISMFDCPNWQSYGPYNRNHYPQPITYTGSGVGVTEDSQGDIWMLYDGVQGGVVQIPNGDVNNSAAWVVWDNVNAGLNLGSATRICADKTGNVWVGYRYATAVSRYSHATNSWTGNFNISQIGGVGEITSIRVDDSNNVWVCGMAGLAKFDQANWTFYTSLNTPMQSGNVLDIAFDSSGNKWIATEHGLYKYDNTNWTLYDHNNTPMFGDWVSTLLFDAKGKLYLHAEDPVFPDVPQGILSFDGTTWLTYTTSNSGLPEKSVRRMALDTLGNIWITTFGNGTAIFNPDGVQGYQCLDKSLTCFSVVPVKMEYFKGKTVIGKNYLTWKASCDGTLSKFEIQRSADNRNYISIGNITATDTRCLSPFDFIDERPLEQMNYYRIKMTDPNDGSTSYSQIIALLNTKTGFEIVSLSPNPVANADAVLAITSSQKQNLRIVVYNMLGKMVYEKGQQIEPGFTQIKLDVGKLPASVYYIKIITDQQEIRSVRFIKQ